MPKVTVTQNTSTVNITGAGDAKLVQVSSPLTNLVRVNSPGPQGPSFDFDFTQKVDKSLVYYDANAEEFKADSIWTTDSIVLGGNF